jgi:hypothetical protein
MLYVLHEAPERHVTVKIVVLLRLLTNFGGFLGEYSKILGVGPISSV